MKEEVKPGTTFDFRAGISTPIGLFTGWQGMMPDLDPGSLPINRPALVLNGRYEAGQIKNRLGLELLSIVPPPWEVTTEVDRSLFAEQITWLGSHHMQANPSMLWMVSFSASTKSGAVYTYNPDISTDVVSCGSFGSTLLVPNGIGAFGGDIYLAGAGKLYRFNARRNEALLVAGVTDGTATIQEFGGRMWLGTSQSWDGISLRTMTGTLNTTATCIWRDSYLIGIAYNSSSYAYGTVDDTWASNGLPGTVTNPYKNALVDYQDAIYVASGGQDIYKVVPGSAGTTVRTLPANSKVMAVCSLGGFLFYAYTVYDGGNSDSFVGIHDPTGASVQWVDQHAPLTGITGEVRAMTVYRNRLVVATEWELATHTLSADATSEWYSISGGSGGVAGLVVVNS